MLQQKSGGGHLTQKASNFAWRLLTRGFNLRRMQELQYHSRMVQCHLPLTRTSTAETPIGWLGWTPHACFAWQTVRAGRAFRGVGMWMRERAVWLYARSSAMVEVHQMVTSIDLESLRARRPTKAFSVGLKVRQQID